MIRNTWFNNPHPGGTNKPPFWLGAKGYYEWMVIPARIIPLPLAKPLIVTAESSGIIPAPQMKEN
jgi:hypothetical protein